MRPSVVAAVLLLAAGALGPRPARAAEDPPAPQPAAAPAPGPFEGPGLDLRAGWGYFESLHLGVGWRISERHAVGLLAGSNLGIPQQALRTLGLDWRYLERRASGLEAAFLVRALYWTAEDDLYRWRLVSAEAGGSFSWPLAPGTRLVLDGTVVRSFTLESDRQQDQAFGGPRAWNVSACLSVSHRVAGW